MKIARATFLSIRGLPDLTWELSKGGVDTPHDVAVVTGPPGSGKTRVLEAILAAKEVLAPYGPPPDPAEWIRPGDRTAKIELTFVLDEEERRLAGGAPSVAKAEALFGPPGVRAEIDEGVADVLERFEHGPAAGKFDYVPAVRGVPLHGAMQGLSSFEQRIHRVTREADKFAFVPRLLVEAGRDAALKARFDLALSKLAPSLAFLGATSEEPAGAFRSRGAAPTSVHGLATSEAEAVMFAASAAMLGLDRSIVLIDRPETSTDERHAGELLAAVASLGDGLQVICASSSPTLLRSVEPGAVLDLGT